MYPNLYKVSIQMHYRVVPSLMVQTGNALVIYTNVGEHIFSAVQNLTKQHPQHK